MEDVVWEAEVGVVPGPFVVEGVEVGVNDE
jgi:hypothetical protein